MLTPLKDEVGQMEDLRHAAQRFRTVLWSFERNLELLFEDRGLVADLDREALALAFSRWRVAFGETREQGQQQPRDFVIFAAGLMLKELIAARPIRSVSLAAVPGGIDASHPLMRWPEGYACTSFCLSVAAAVLQEMGETAPVEAPAVAEAAFWDSFRENTHESPTTAVAFFDMVCGRDPNWAAPDVLWLRPDQTGPRLA